MPPPPETSRRHPAFRPCTPPARCLPLPPAGPLRLPARPEVRGEVQQLARIVRQHPGSPMSLFGHADPVGNDDYNKVLSGRRVAAIYGMLTRDADIWEDLFSNKGAFAQPAAGDKWGNK